MRYISLLAVFLLVAACLGTLLGLPVFSFLAFPLLLASLGRAGIKLIPLLWDKAGGSRDLSILHNKKPSPMPVAKPSAESPFLDGLTGILWLVVTWHFRHLVIFSIVGVGLGGFRASLFIILGLTVAIAATCYLAFDYLARRWRFAELVLVVLFAVVSLLPVGWLQGAHILPVPGSVTIGSVTIHSSQATAGHSPALGRRDLLGSPDETGRQEWRCDSAWHQVSVAPSQCWHQVNVCPEDQAGRLLRRSFERAGLGIVTIPIKLSEWRCQG